MSLQILVVDDEKLSRLSLTEQLNDIGHSAQSHESPFSALEVLAKEPWDLVISDLKMPSMDGQQFLREIKKTCPETDVILMSAKGSIQAAVQAMRDGAIDFLVKPFSFEELEVRLSMLEQNRGMRRELAALRRTVNATPRGNLVGGSPGIRKVQQLVERFGPLPSSVLITGETGTGKEVVAKALHAASRRAGGPFVPVACGAIPKDLAESELFGHEQGAFTGAARRRKGRVELAKGGTLFLDDVDDLSLEIQVKLLRVLQEKQFDRVGGEQTLSTDIRVIAATKVNLESWSKQGRFREDLLYRLRVLTIDLPPLRERSDDVLILAQHFLDMFARDRGIPAKTLAPEAAERLVGYGWPGNVRQLQHVIEYAVAVSPGAEINLDDLPVELAGAARVETSDSLINFNADDREDIDLRQLLDSVEADAIRWALKKAGGNQVLASQFLKIPRTTLLNKLRQIKQ